MTDKKLDQILKQALAPEIDDSEIQIRRKVRDKMSMKKIIAGGLVACAALTLIVSVGGFGGHTKSGDSGNAGLNDGHVASHNFFAITAHAAELPEGAASGDVIELSKVQVGHGSSLYLDGRFTISGQNIDKIKVTTDKCNLYTSVPAYNGDSDYSQIVGQSYEGEYNDQMSFGMSVPEELWSTSDDPKAGYWEDVDQVNGAKITVEATFSDGSTEIHHYRLNTGKIFVPADDNGNLQWDKLTRFLTADEENRETPFSYGYLMEKID